MIPAFIRPLGIALLIFGLISLLESHPAFHHHFNSLINANPCTKACIEELEKLEPMEEEVELSLVKTSNFSEYFLNLSSICSAITSSKGCLDACKVDSNQNPFALESMNSACTPQSVIEISVLTPCLFEHGNRINEECEKECGDHDKLTEAVDTTNEKYKPGDGNQEIGVKEERRLKNDICRVHKCSNRCATKKMNEKCGDLADKRPAGTVMQAVIDRVLLAHRRDLEKMKALETMAQNVPIECTFMYLPEAMFNESIDKGAMALVETVEKHDLSPAKTATILPSILPNIGSADTGSVPAAILSMNSNSPMAPILSPTTNPMSNVNLAFSQFQAYLMKKQVRLMELQEKNLKQEGQKLDMEMKLINETKQTIKDTEKKMLRY